MTHKHKTHNIYTYKQYMSACEASVCTLKYAHILRKHAVVMSLFRARNFLVPKQLEDSNTDVEKKTTLISRLGELSIDQLLRLVGVWKDRRHNSQLVVAVKF